MSDVSPNADVDCPFCAIASGRDTPVHVICETDLWVAFFPPEPATRGHTLIIPRQHFADLWSITPEIGGPLMSAAVAVGRAITSVLAPDGLNLISSSGAAAEQTVFHVHLHVVPRWQADGFGQIWPSDGGVHPNELGPLANVLRDACRP